MPKISVLTPLYNTNPQQLREMIASILGQTFDDFELLLLNDSPDNAELAEIVGEFDDPRIHFEVNERNLGISESRNKLLEMALGEYIAIFDHDDISAPDRLAKEVAYLDAHPEVGVVGCWTRKLGASGVLHFPVENLAIKRAMLCECVIVHSSAMIRKSVMMENNIRWRESYSPAEDYKLWAELFHVTLFHNIPEELLQWRIHDDSWGARCREQMADAAMRVRSQLQRDYPVLLRRTRWVRLFGFIPLVKIHERGADDVRWLLLGVLPIARVY